MQWMQYTVDTVDGGGDIVFDTKRSKWTQWMQYSVDAVCSGCIRIVEYGGGDIVFRAKRSKERMQYAVD